METNGIEILKRSADYWSWEKLIQHCDTLQELTDFERERAKEAFRQVRQELGENFFKDAFEGRNPICQYILNQAPWTRKWITRFADEIKELKDHENYSSLLKRLKDAQRFYEGISVLEIGYKFSKAGFDISFDPLVNVLGRNKVPDLKLTDRDTKEELFVEVSVLGQSKIDRDAFQTLQIITEITWRSMPFLYSCGRIHKTLSKVHLNRIATRIQEIVKRVRRNGGFQEFIIDEVIELGMATKDGKKVLEKWATERGLRIGELFGPPSEVNEISRAKGKIRSEQKQLPHDYPTILVIEHHSLFLHARDITKIINELEEEVYEYPHLLAVVVAGGYMGSGMRAITTKDQHLFITKPRPDLYTEQVLVLFNQFCELKISPTAITKMYNSLRLY